MSALGFQRIPPTLVTCIVPIAISSFLRHDLAILSVAWQVGLRYSTPHMSAGAISTLRTGRLAEAWLVSALSHIRPDGSNLKPPISGCFVSLTLPPSLSLTHPSCCAAGSSAPHPQAARQYGLTFGLCITPLNGEGLSPLIRSEVRMS